MPGLHIALVSAFPPGTRPLSEYAGHLVEALCAADGVQHVSVLADRGRGSAAYADGRREVIPCWRFGSPFLAAPVIRAARTLKPDALWFNLHMTSAGNTRASWFGGLCAPALARAAGFKVIVTLHNLPDMTDLDKSGVRARRWDVAAAHLAVRSLGSADAVCVLRPEYVPILRTRYGVPRVAYVPHGTLGLPAAAPGQRDGKRILAFGRFGTYKRLEPVIEAVSALSRAGTAVRLTIGGTDSRHSRGYLERLQQRCRSMSNVEFLGYVPERSVPALFQSATACVLPYATSTGMSGVAVLAAMHRVPILASDIGAFRALECQGLRMRFFRWPDANDLAHQIGALLAAPDEQERLARGSLEFVRAQSMDVVASSYVRLIAAVVSSPHRRKQGSCMDLEAPAAAFTGEGDLTSPTYVA